MKTWEVIALCLGIVVHGVAAEGPGAHPRSSSLRGVATRTRSNIIQSNNATARELKVDMDEMRVYAGTGATPGEFPWFVYGLGCGGSLLYKDVVLTARHCGSVFAKGYPVWVGAVKADSTDYGAEQLFVADSIKHPIADILVVGLDGYSTKPTVTLNRNRRQPQGKKQKLRLLGFGETKYQLFPDTLQTAMVTYMPNSICKQRRKKFDSKYDLCATQQHQAACFGGEFCDSIPAFAPALVMSAFAYPFVDALLNFFRASNLRRFRWPPPLIQ